MAAISSSNFSQTLDISQTDLEQSGQAYLPAQFKLLNNGAGADSGRYLRRGGRDSLIVLLHLLQAVQVDGVTTRHNGHVIC